MPELIMFTADYCAACKKAKPIIEKLQRDGICKVTVLDTDIPENGVLANNYGIGSLPGFVIEHKDDIRVFTGLQPEAVLREAISCPA